MEVCLQLPLLLNRSTGPEGRQQLLLAAAKEILELKAISVFRVFHA